MYINGGRKLTVQVLPEVESLAGHRLFGPISYILPLTTHILEVIQVRIVLNVERGLVSRRGVLVIGQCECVPGSTR